MVDILTPTERSQRMSRIRGKNTKPEVTVRRMLYSSGYRYRLHRGDLPGKPDIVFPGRKKAIYVHGCYWHRHSDPKCRLARLPKSRLDFWLPKLEGNRKRDVRNQAALKKLGWEYLVVWECEIRNLEQLQLGLSSFLDD